MYTCATSHQSIRTAASGRRSTSKALSVFKDTGISNVRDRTVLVVKILLKKKKETEEDGTKMLSTKKTDPKKTMKSEAYEDDRQPTKLLGRAFKGCV